MLKENSQLAIIRRSQLNPVRRYMFFFLQENERSKDIMIDQRFHKQIIGSKGEKIREIRDRFNGIQISFPEPGEKKDVVTLRGPKQDVEKCVTHLKKMVADLVRGRERGNLRGRDSV